MSKDKVEGVRYMEFLKQNIMNGALDLIDRGYAVKIHLKDEYLEETANYRLTERGIEFLDKILKYATKQF